MCAPCPSIERWMARYCGCKKSSFHHKFTSLIFFVGIRGSSLAFFHCSLWSTTWVKPHNIPQDIWLFFLHSFLVLSFDFNWRFYDFSHSSCIYHNIQKLFSCCGPWLKFESSSFYESVVLGEMNVKWTITRWLKCSIVIPSRLLLNNVINSELWKWLHKSCLKDSTCSCSIFGMSTIHFKSQITSIVCSVSLHNLTN